MDPTDKVLRILIKPEMLANIKEIVSLCEAYQLNKTMQIKKWFIRLRPEYARNNIDWQIVKETLLALIRGEQYV